MEVPDVTILPNWSGGGCMQAGDAYSSWAPDLTPIPGVRFFSYVRRFCLCLWFLFYPGFVCLRFVIFWMIDFELLTGIWSLFIFVIPCFMDDLYLFRSPKVKQGQRSLILKNGFWTIFDSNCNYNHEACQKYLSWIKDDPSCFWSPKVKVVERRWLKKWFPDHIWVIISPIIRKLSKNYSLESECPLFILGSKGQRSRS